MGCILGGDTPGSSQDNVGTNGRSKDRYLSDLETVRERPGDESPSKQEFVTLASEVSALKAEVEKLAKVFAEIQGALDDK